MFGKFDFIVVEDGECLFVDPMYDMDCVLTRREFNVSEAFNNVDLEIKTLHSAGLVLAGRVTELIRKISYNEYSKDHLMSDIVDVMIFADYIIYKEKLELEEVTPYTSSSFDMNAILVSLMGDIRGIVDEIYMKDKDDDYKKVMEEFMWQLKDDLEFVIFLKEMDHSKIDNIYQVKLCALSDVCEKRNKDQLL